MTESTNEAPKVPTAPVVETPKVETHVPDVKAATPPKPKKDTRAAVNERANAHLADEAESGLLNFAEGAEPNKK